MKVTKTWFDSAGRVAQTHKTDRLSVADMRYMWDLSRTAGEAHFWSEGLIEHMVATDKDSQGRVRVVTEVEA